MILAVGAQIVNLNTGRSAEAHELTKAKQTRNMGIQKLMTLIQEKAPRAVKQVHLDHMTGKVVACDASMAIYQFLIATQGFNRMGAAAGSN